jgi:hypothetical protein
VPSWLSYNYKMIVFEHSSTRHQSLNNFKLNLKSNWNLDLSQIKLENS